MTIRNLQFLFKPKSVALIGASKQPGSVGALVARNLFRSGFDGPIMPVNPKHDAIEGVLAYPDVKSLPLVPDLAVIATPPETVPGIVADLAARGTKGAVVITAGFGEGGQARGAELRQAMLDAGKHQLVRIVGPNCLGIMVPGIGLNASFARVDPLPGRLALVAQSGAMVAAAVDWATSRGIGFSHLVSLGDMADVDFGDMLDYLANDPETRAILLYVEMITHARKFMSAGRAAARMKPVIVVKAGRHAEGARAAASHTGALVGADAVYDTAFRRAGMLRVLRLEELFDAVQTLAAAQPPRGDRLAIVTNGGGAGVLATDALIDLGGRLAELAPETIGRLDRVLPATWPRANPVDIIGDAPAERYAEALDARHAGQRGGRRRRSQLPHGGRVAQGRGAGRGRGGGQAQAPAGADELARRSRRRGGKAAVRRARHSDLRHARRRGRRVHADGRLPAQSGDPDADAALARRGAASPTRRRRRRSSPRRWPRDGAG